MNVLPGILYAFENCLAASGRQIYRAIKVQNKKKKLKNLCSVRRSPISPATAIIMAN